MPLLKDPSPEVRLSAARALEALEAAQSLEEVLATLKQGDRGAKIGAIYALGRIGGQRVLAPLFYCAGRSEEDIRCAAVKVLGELARPEAIPTLLEKLQDPSRAVRAYAIEALSRYRDPSLARHLVPFLEENDGLLEAEAALALGRLGASDQEERLAALTRSPHEKTRAPPATAHTQLPKTRSSGKPRSPSPVGPPGRRSAPLPVPASSAPARAARRRCGP
jgi:HEAT repeat protein